jgi:hypothetical protein
MELMRLLANGRYQHPHQPGERQVQHSPLPRQIEPGKPGTQHRVNLQPLLLHQPVNRHVLQILTPHPLMVPLLAVSERLKQHKLTVGCGERWP